MPERNEFSVKGEEPLLSVSEYYGVKPRSEAFSDDSADGRAESLEGYRIVKAGDFVMNYMLAWKGAYGVSDYEGIVSPAYAVYRIDTSIADKRFIHHCLRSKYMCSKFRARSKGIIESRLRLYPEIFQSMEIDLPDLKIQKVIADFLDRETIRVDQLIEKKQRLVELAEEKKSGLITAAVTDRIDIGTEKFQPHNGNGDDRKHGGCVPSERGSGGDRKFFSSISLSADWKAIRLSNLCGNKGFFKDGDWIESPYITDRGIRLIQTGNIGVGHYKEKGYRYVSEDTFRLFNCTEVCAGDLLICRLAEPVGRACLAPALGVRAITSVDNAILRISDQHHTHYFLYVFSSKPYLDYLKSECRGGTRNRVSRSFLARLRLPVPNRETQKSIADFLDREIDRIDALKFKTLTSIDRLREYRSALITAAVTRQIDVAEWDKRDQINHSIDAIEATQA